MHHSYETSWVDLCNYVTLWFSFVDVLGCTKSLRTVLHHPLLLPAPGGAPHALSSPQQVLHKIHLADVRAERMRGMLQVHQTEQNSLPAKVRHLESLLAEIKHDCLDVDMSLCEYSQRTIYIYVRTYIIQFIELQQHELINSERFDPEVFISIYLIMIATSTPNSFI